MSKAKLKIELEQATSTKLSDETVDEIVKDVVEEIFDNTSSIGLVKESVKEEAVEVKGFSVKFKGMYTTTLIVLALVAMVWVLQACTSTYTLNSTLNSTQIQNVGNDNPTSSDVTTKVETKTKSVNQVKIL